MQKYKNRDKCSIKETRIPRLFSSKDECFGCGACYAICLIKSANAISMEKDAEGFCYPVVDLSKCIGCKLCEKTCPSKFSNEQ